MSGADRVVVVTGASRGIGRGVAEHFLAQGSTVVGLSRTAQAYLEHPHFRQLAGDVTDEASVRAAFRAIRKEHDRLDVLINCAGVLTTQHSLLLPARAAEEMLRTNVLGPFFVSREAAKLMMTRKYGRIVNISSMAVPLAPAGDAMYSASKSALTQLTRVMAKELAGENITCNVLGITAIATEMSRQVPPAALQDILQRLPLKGYASLADVTNVIEFFARPESASVTGQVVYLGGVF